VVQRADRRPCHHANAAKIKADASAVRRFVTVLGFCRIRPDIGLTNRGVTRAYFRPAGAAIAALAVMLVRLLGMAAGA